MRVLCKIVFVLVQIFKQLTLADQIASEAVGWGRGDVAVGIPAHADAVVVILPFGAIGNAVVGVSERVEGEIHDVRNARSVQSMI
jgi:hypothetical protein